MASNKRWIVLHAINADPDQQRKDILKRPLGPWSRGWKKSNVSSEMGLKNIVLEKMETFPLLSGWSLENQNSAEWGCGVRQNENHPVFLNKWGDASSYFFCLSVRVWRHYQNTVIGVEQNGRKWTLFWRWQWWKLSCLLFGGHKLAQSMVEEQNGERSMSYPLRFGCNFLVGQNTEKQDVRFKMILQKVFKYTLWCSQKLAKSQFFEKRFEAQKSRSNVFNIRSKRQIVLIVVFAIFFGDENQKII